MSNAVKTQETDVVKPTAKPSDMCRQGLLSLATKTTGKRGGAASMLAELALSYSIPVNDRDPIEFRIRPLDEVLTDLAALTEQVILDLEQIKGGLGRVTLKRGEYDANVSTPIESVMLGIAGAKGTSVSKGLRTFKTANKA